MRYYVLGILFLLSVCLPAFPAYSPSGGTNRMYFNYTSDFDANWVEVAADKVLNEMRVSSGKAGVTKPVYPLLLSASNSALHLFINTNGNIGILTNNPSVPLHVHGSIYAVSNMHAGYSVTVTPPPGYDNITFNVTHTNNVSVIMVSNGVLYINGSTNYGGGTNIYTGSGSTNMPYLWIGTNQFFKVYQSSNTSGTIPVVFTNGAIQFIKAMGAMTFSGQPPPNFTNESTTVSFLIDANGTNRNLLFDPDWKWLGVQPTILNSNNFGFLTCLCYSNQAESVFAAYNSTDSTNASYSVVTNFYYTNSITTNVYFTNTVVTNLFYTNELFTNIYFTNNFYGTNTVITNYYFTNTVGTNLYFTNEVFTNVFFTNTVITNLYFTNDWFTNIYYTNNFFGTNTVYYTNEFYTNLFTTNWVYTNVYTTNLITYTNDVTGTNMGTGAIIYTTNVGSQLRFKTLISQNTGITLSEGSDTLTLINNTNYMSNFDLLPTNGQIATFNTGGTITWENAPTNGFVDSNITNYSTTTNYAFTLASNLVRVISGTNANVTVSNYAGAMYYFISVPGTNGFVDQNITNYSTTTNYAFTLASNLVRVVAGTNANVTVSNYAGAMYYFVSVPGTNGFVDSSIINGLATTNYVITNFVNINGGVATNLALGGTASFYAPAYSYTTSASNGPAGNEFPTAGWVRNLLSGSGYIYYNTTNITSFTNTDATTVVYLYTNSTPQYQASRTYNAVVSSQYVGSTATTNTFQFIQGPVIVNTYMGISSLSGKSAQIKAEIYFSYDGTNWFGDYDCAYQTLSTGSNLYQFAITFPPYTSTNSSGFYIERRLKMGTVVGAPDLSIYVGTNTPSHISFTGPSSLVGGEINTLSNASTVNSLRFGIDAGKDGTVLKVKTISEGNGIQINGYTTNLEISVLASVTNELATTNYVHDVITNLNYITNASTINSVRFGIPAYRSGYTNFLRTLSEGNGIEIDNFVTNLQINVLASVTNQLASTNWVMEMIDGWNYTNSLEIWFDDRTDSDPGDGTASNPFNAGGTNALDARNKFDAKMLQITRTNDDVDINVTIRLGPGTYYTAGFVPAVGRGARTDATDWYVKGGMRISGSGMANTIVKLYTTNDAVENQAHYAFFTGMNKTNIEMTDFTIDCDATNNMSRSLKTNVSFAAIQLVGENLSVRRIHAINWGNNSYAAPGPDPGIGVETFVIGLTAYNTDPQRWHTVEGCVIDQPMKGTDHANAVPIIITASNGRVFNGYVLNNYIDGAWPDLGYDPETNFITAIQVMRSHNMIVQGNHVANVRFGMYMDTGVADDVAIIGNTFRNVEMGLYYFLSAGESIDILRISGNMFEINSKGSPYSIGIYSLQEDAGELSITNIIITGNLFKLGTYVPPVSWTETAYAAVIEDSKNLHFHDNVVMGFTRTNALQLTNVANVSAWNNVGYNTNVYIWSQDENKYVGGRTLTHINGVVENTSTEFDTAIIHQLLYEESSDGDIVSLGGIAEGEYLKRVGDVIQGAAITASGSAIAIQTNQVTISSTPTNLNFIAGDNITIIATNKSSGSTVDVVIASTGGSAYYPGGITNAVSRGYDKNFTPFTIESIAGTTSNVFNVLNTNGSIGFAVDSNITLMLPRNAAPNLYLPGMLSFDTNAWSTTNGSIVFNDGVNTNVVLSTRESDTPANYEVARWSTNGYVEWDYYPINYLQYPIDARFLYMTNFIFSMIWDKPTASMIVDGNPVATGNNGYFIVDIQADSNPSLPDPQISFIQPSGSFDTGTFILIKTVDSDLTPLVIGGTSAYGIVSTNKIKTLATFITSGTSKTNEFAFLASDGSITNAPLGAYLGNIELTNSVISNAFMRSGVISNDVNIVKLTNDVYRTIWISSGAMRTNSAGSPSAGTYEYPLVAGGIVQDTWDFDGGSAETNSFSLTLPDEWDGANVKAKIYWTQTFTNADNAVVWGLSGINIPVGQYLTNHPNFGTEVTCTNNCGETNSVHVATNSVGITLGGLPTTNGLSIFRIRRVPADGGDTMSGADARLLGVELQYRINKWSNTVW